MYSTCKSVAQMNVCVLCVFMRGMGDTRNGRIVSLPLYCAFLPYNFQISPAKHSKRFIRSSDENKFEIVINIEAWI